MTQIQNSEQYDLEERTFQFAKNIAKYIKTLPKTISNTEYSSQVVRSSGSVGANYIEANESLSKKDFLNEDQDLPKGSKRISVLAKADCRNE